MYFLWECSCYWSWYLYKMIILTYDTVIISCLKYNIVAVEKDMDRISLACVHGLHFIYDPLSIPDNRLEWLFYQSHTQFIAQLHVQWYFLCCFKYGEYGWTRVRFHFHKWQSRLVNYLEYRILRQQRVNIPTGPCLPKELSKPNLPMYFLTRWGRDKWTPFRRRHFQMHFREWKYMNFDWNFIEVCS